MGSQSTIFLNHPKTVRKLLSSNEFKSFTNDRPPTFIGKYICYDIHNTAFTSNSATQQQRRRTFHSVMRFYGENLCRVEGLILDTIDQLADTLRVQTDVDVSSAVSECVLTVIHKLLAGDAIDNGHIDALKEFNMHWEKFFVFEIETVLQCFPILRFIPGLPFKRKYESLCSARDKLMNYYFHDMKKTYMKGHERGIIDYLMTSQSEFHDAGDVTTITDQTVMASICETSSASYISSTSTINILLLMALRHPHIQDRMYSDICQVDTEGGPIMLKHRRQVPYIEAAVLEVLRFSSMSPFLVPHYTREDISFEGSHIPKNSVLVINAWFCHRREDLWPDPWSFKPDR